MDGSVPFVAGNDASPSREPPLSTSLLVGRSLEQAHLFGLLEDALAGRGRLILLGGEAGIGKTTLARHLIGEAEVRGARILTGHCYDRTNAPPYGPWLELFENTAIEPPMPTPPNALAGGRLTRVADQAA